MQPIHVIGDSHVTFFCGRNETFPKVLRKHKDLLPMFKTYHFGAPTAYNLGQYGSSSRGREKLEQALTLIPKGSSVLFVFGEIDCRVHLLKQSQIQKRPLRDVVRECVSRYMSLIFQIKDKGYTVVVWHVTPTASVPEGKEDISSYGTARQRNRITKLFNWFLSKYVVPQVSIYDYLVDKDNRTKDEFYLDYTHLSQKAMPFALEEFKKAGIL